MIFFPIRLEKCVLFLISSFFPLAQWALLLFCIIFAFVVWFSHCSHNIMPHLNFFVCLFMVLLVAAFISTVGKKNCNFLSRKKPISLLQISLLSLWLFCLRSAWISACGYPEHLLLNSCLDKQLVILVLPFSGSV